MFWKSRLQNGSSSVMPSEPLVSDVQLVATICAASSSAIVMMTNAWPRVRSTTEPISTATTHRDHAAERRDPERVHARCAAR